jgi:uncharacterized protein (TIGR02246 family)
MIADAGVEAAVLDILERFCGGFATGDREAIVDVFAPDGDVVMVTSEPALLRGPDAIRSFVDRYVGGTTRYSWTWRRRDVSAAGAVGWVLAEGTETVAHNAGDEVHPYRMSAVCERRGDRWFLMQIHGSSPQPG